MRLGKSSAIATVMAALAIFGAAPAAQAASTSLSGTVCTCGTWTTYDNVRTKDGYGNMVLAMTNKTYGNTHIAVARADGSRFSGVTTYSATGTKTLATGVIGGTQFRMQARMDDHSGWGADNSWAGSLSY